MMKRTSWR